MKTKVLNKINDEIKELERKRELIENLKIAAVDEKTWHEICLTPARYEHELIEEIAKATFPQGKNFEVGVNEVEFTLNGFNIELPTCTYKGIKIDLRWFKPDYKEPPEIVNRYEHMKRYFELLDSKNYTWYDLAKCRCGCRDEWNKLKMFIWWFREAKWHKVDRSKWEDAFKDEDDYNKIKLEEHNKKVKDIEEKLSKINETIDILKQFAEVRGYVELDDGIWQMTNVENYFR